MGHNTGQSGSQVLMNQLFNYHFKIFKDLKNLKTMAQMLFSKLRHNHNRERGLYHHVKRRADILNFNNRDCRYKIVNLCKLPT